MQIKIPKHAAEIIHKLHMNGYEAYVVGGCVRDSILGRIPSDWDITTSATPAQVKALFFRTIDTGLKHGTVTVLLDHEPYEVTTFRTGAHFQDNVPAECLFADTLEEDLAHRDLTINAMAYNDRDGLIDIFGGMDDINRGVIRCIGYADDRIHEDPLRMLRVIRFAGQLGFKIDESTYASIQKNHALLSNVSAERIQVELMKLLISPHPELIRNAYEVGLTSVFLPEFDVMMQTPQNNPHHMYTVGEHTIHAVCNIEANPLLRLTMLLHDVAKPPCRSTDEQGIDHFYEHNEVGSKMSVKILKRLKFDNKTIQMVSTLINYHDDRFEQPLESGRKNVRYLMHKVTAPLFPYLLQVMIADVSAQSSYMQENKLSILADAKKCSYEILAAKDCLSLKELKINGKQLIAMGITDGKIIGAILNTLLTMVLEDPDLNQYLVLKGLAKEIYTQITEG